MKSPRKLKLIIYGLFPLLAILACNAPVDELLSEQLESQSTPRPTVGPPPTLTPIVLGESEYVVITLVATPTITPTPTETPTITPTTDPDSIRATLLATATIDPEFSDQEIETPDASQNLSPLRLIYYADWQEIPESDEELEEGVEPEIIIPAGEVVFAEDVEVYRDIYAGRLVLEGRGGNGVYAYYINGERLSGQVLLLSMDNCQVRNLEITVQSLGSEPYLQEIVLKAPCLGQ
ncbi:MAG: hypothetical protein AAGD96_11700 [Chloroflexota bacterium]